MNAITGAFTVNDVVTAGLRKSGIMGLGQSPYPSGSDVIDAQDDLSDMLAQWNSETWLVWHKLDLGFISDGRAGPGMGGAYTVGPGGNYPLTPRPDRVEKAYIRVTSLSPMPVDQPLEQLPSREDYANVALKRLVAFTRAYFYDSSSPLGNIYFYPWPSASIYEMHIVVKDVFPLLLPLNTDLSMLPPPCRAAMKFNLALRLRQAYGKGLRPDPELKLLAKKSLEIMRSSQIQVPELRMPLMLRVGAGRYNVYGDIYY